MEIIDDIKPTEIYSAPAVGPFDIAKRALERKGYEVISLEQSAQLRIQQGPNHNISKNGNWVREGTLYVPGKGKFLTKKSPIMQNPTKATNAHRNREDFYLTNNQVKSALEDSVLLSASEIPTNRFGEDEVTVFAFGKTATQYGDFLRQNGIDSMPIYTANLQDKPFARQMWFRSLGDGSDLDGDNRYLYYDNRLRGVKFSAEGTRRKGTRTGNTLGVA